MEANLLTRLRMGEEIDCPACGRYCKLYHRRIHANMARQLIALYRMCGHLVMSGKSPEVHTRDVRKMCGYSDFTLAKHWDLVRAGQNITSPNKKDSGYWYMTDKGRQFVLGEISIPKYAYLFDDKCVGYSDDVITIAGALGKKFNYQELFDAPLLSKEIRNAV